MIEFAPFSCINFPFLLFGAINTLCCTELKSHFTFLKLSCLQLPYATSTVDFPVETHLYAGTAVVSAGLGGLECANGLAYIYSPPQRPLHLPKKIRAITPTKENSELATCNTTHPTHRTRMEQHRPIVTGRTGCIFGTANHMACDSF